MKNNIKQTSVSAYFKLRGRGQDLNQKGKIFAFFHMHTGTLTRSELSEKTGIRINAVCGRVNELIKDGYLMEVKKRMCTVTGLDVNPLKLTGKS